MKKAVQFAVALALTGSLASKGLAVTTVIFHTEAGDITCELYPDKAPKTVENFIGLAKGTKTWQNPETNAVMTDKPLYNGTKFHRTMPGFMIQGGDPLGTGAGGPGYTFKDEYSDLKFDRAGRLAMANRGKDTNGSQFFITVAPQPGLDDGGPGHYTIFGQVTSGQDVADKISKMPSQPGSGKAMNPVTLKSVEVVEKAAGGEKSDSKTSASK